MKREMTCISCPVGCRLTVTVDGDKIFVEGNHCKRGVVYAENEVKNPSRTVTSTVSIEGARDFVMQKEWNVVVLETLCNVAVESA